ncbi:MAG: histidinol dehydrogenase [Betaproteobacteria bacterium]|jgi:histidinol dehydrogenase|nr:histidinol dehydrogenase [Rhodocyclaceae bacterium]MCA3141322.1 histidinol dehydrogenase [Rhodocyclaceae bacterium]
MNAPVARPVSFHELDRLDAAARAALLARAESDLTPFLERVKPIVEAVRAEGDAAILRFARDIDRVDLPPGGIAATKADFDRAFTRVDRAVIEAIEYAVENIRRFHEEQKPESMWMKEIRPGAFAGDRWLPIPSVACYVPRGKGAFPSVVMMTTVPAVVAGVPEICIVTPPGPGGDFDDATLVAARIAGVDTVYRVGGAVAVAAVAYGTDSVRRCAKIVGPGSPWVVAAKRLLAGVLDTGIPAGPSESIVLADDTADGALVALDLLIEAEHGPDSSAYLVTASRRVAEEAIAALPGHWARMGAQRVEYSSTVLCGPRGGVILAPDMEAACAFTNDYAPEHLLIHAEEPFQWVGKIHHAGEILLGRHTPITLGNFVLGPNAVLPTSGWARTFSPLSVFDYMKRTGIGYVTSVGYPELARHARVLAAYEGFEAHANAVSEVRDALIAKGSRP